MGRLMRRLAAVAVALCLAGAAVGAERMTVTLADGTEMEFALALPADFRPDATYPALLVIPGGEQTIEGAIGQVERLWETEAARRGYLVFGLSALWGGERPFHGQFRSSWTRCARSSSSSTASSIWPASVLAPKAPSGLPPSAQTCSDR
jgi:hypothetical protein